VFKKDTYQTHIYATIQKQVFIFLIFMLCWSPWNGNAEAVPNTVPVASANAYFNLLCFSFSVRKSPTNWWKV